MIEKKYTMSETAKELGISRATLYRYIENKTINPRYSPGGAPFLIKEDIDLYREVLKNGIRVSEDKQ